ncbi:MAG: CRISPR-associated protein [bacterium]
MLLNLSNHPLDKWSAEQREAAEQQFGAVEDMPFPQLDPGASLEAINAVVDDYLTKCTERLKTAKTDAANAIHLMGEYTFSYQFLKKMEALGIPCVASTTERIVTNNPDGSKTTVFKFVQFRPYF